MRSKWNQQGKAENNRNRKWDEQEMECAEKGMKRIREMSRKWNEQKME